jgi:hypothetical protein
MEQDFFLLKEVYKERSGDNSFLKNHSSLSLFITPKLYGEQSPSSPATAVLLIYPGARALPIR